MKERMMATATADQIRAYVNKAFLEPAKRAGKTAVEVIAGDVHADLKLDNRMPAICSALDAQKFQEQYRVILSSRSGPKQSSTAKWRFSFLR
jgi:5-methylcytosine-specific restriction enzyme B